jgi:hypothetical protein
MVKFGFIMVSAIASPLTRHFLVVGILKSAGLHLLFGAGAGLLGWGAYKVWQLKRNESKSG